MKTINDHFETISAHLTAALQGDLPPSFRAPGMNELLDALAHVAVAGSSSNYERLGVLTAQLIIQRLKASMQAERDSAAALQQHRLQ